MFFLYIQKIDKKTYIDKLVKIIYKKNFLFYQFKSVEHYTSNINNTEYKKNLV